MHGWKAKENVVIPSHEFELLKELELLVEKSGKVFVNIKRIAAVETDNTLKYFAHIPLNAHFVAINLQEHFSQTLRFDSTCVKEVIAGLEVHV